MNKAMNIGYYEIAVRLNEISAALTLFADTMDSELAGAEKMLDECGKGNCLGYIDQVFPALHEIRRSLWDLEENVKEQEAKS